jgi:hypothetical protein
VVDAPDDSGCTLVTVRQRRHNRYAFDSPRTVWMIFAKPMCTAADNAFGIHNTGRGELPIK